MNFTRDFFKKCSKICECLDYTIVDEIAGCLAKIRERRGRLFILGVGGSAGNASHAVNDFRKLCDLEAYAPTDNVSELTARVNDEGWDTVFVEWLRVSRASELDGVLVFSVGGGNSEKGVSTNLVKALDFAHSKNIDIFAIVGREDGHASKLGKKVVVVPVIDESLVTPFTESLQTLVWHCLVSHPELKVNKTKW